MKKRTCSWSIAAGVAIMAGLGALSPVARAQCVGYSTTLSTGSIIPGVTDVGNHCDDCTTSVTLPFPVSFYGTAYSTAYVSSNGNVQFTTTGTSPANYNNGCLPDPSFDAAICPHWDDLYSLSSGFGTYSAATGTAPNRRFVLEWRTQYFPGNGNADFEVVFYENQTYFDFIYGALSDGASNATIGVQQAGAAGSRITQFSCNPGTPPVASGTVIHFDCLTTATPSCNLGVSPANATIGGTFTATAHVTPGVGPVSTGLAVSLDASSVDGGIVALHDDGIAPDVTAGDNVFTGTVTVGPAATGGVHPLTSTVQDDQLRTSGCSALFTVVARPSTYEDMGTWTTPHTETRTRTLAASEVHWYKVVLPAIATPGSWLDMWTPSTSTPNTFIGIYDDNGTLKASDNDSGVNVFALSFGNTSYPRNSLGGDALAFNGRNGSLAAGTYWIALTTANATFNTGWLVSSSGTGGGPISFTFDANVPLNPAGTGAANPSTLYNCPGSTVLLTVATTPGVNPPSTGISVTTDLSAIGGSSTQVFYNDGTHGDAVAGDNTFSFSASIPSSVAPGDKTMTFTVSDAQSRSSTGSIPMTINACPTSGPDVYVGGLTDVEYFGNVGGATATGIYAYAVGTDACNAGDTTVKWINGVNQHPVIAQNMYRLKSGRFEQLGQSWLKHGFVSTNSNFCGTCIQPPEGGARLGIHCSDAYGAGLNGDQPELGPRSEVNATMGAYPWPHSSGDTSVIGMRLQVHYPDIDPAANAGARYFAEGHYVTADDATYVNTTPPNNIHGNGLNNATWREVSMSNPTTTSIPFIGNDNPMQHPIMAWHTIDPTVVIANGDYMDTNITARFYVGAKATSNGDGTWNYEYAVANMNADRSGGTFSVPLPPNAVVTNTGFHDVDSHSGEPYENTATSPADWTSTVSSNGITWASGHTYAQNVNANALRWGTLYNFRFTANVAPNARPGR